MNCGCAPLDRIHLDQSVLELQGAPSAPSHP